MCDKRPDHAASRVLPLTVLELTVDAAEVVASVEPGVRGRVAFVLAETTHERGLAAFGLGLRAAGNTANPYPAPDKDKKGVRAFPPASMLIPPSNHRAEEYASPFRDMEIGTGDRLDMVVQDLTDGDLPYKVKVFFFLYPSECR